jgi:hypothetical protein
MRREYKGPKTGDVLLLNGDTWRSKKNKTLQTLKSGKHAEYSHVALCLSLSKYIHADLNGVHLILVDELFRQYPGQWKAIRNATMEKLGDSEYTTVYIRSLSFLEMPYAKWKSLVRRRRLKDETICSILVKDIYYQLGLEIAPKYSQPLPVHFQSLPGDREGEWRDVTDEHLIGRKIWTDHPELRETAADLIRLAKWQRTEIKQLERVRTIINQHLKGSHSPNTISQVQDVFEYWDLPAKKR